MSRPVQGSRVPDQISPQDSLARLQALCAAVRPAIRPQVQPSQNSLSSANPQPSQEFCFITALLYIPRMISAAFMKLITCCSRAQQAPAPQMPLAQVPAPAPQVPAPQVPAPAPAPIAPIAPVALSPQMQDKIKGVVRGQAYGDAIGLLTEFLTEAEAVALINGEPLEYALKDSDRFRNGVGHRHRNRFNPGWTDDTDQAVAIVRALHRKHQGAPENSQQLFANELLQWRHHGLRGRNNAMCMGIGQLVLSVLGRPNFAQSPQDAALAVWRNPPFALRGPEFEHHPAANGAVMRTAYIGAIYHRDLNLVEQQTKMMCKVTHVDPRCVASSVAVTTAIALMMQGEENIDVVMQRSCEIAKRVLAEEMAAMAPNLLPEERDHLAELTLRCQNELEAHMYGNWQSLRLDEPQKIGYTYKCMGSAFYALRLAEQNRQANGLTPSIRRAIEELVAKGGDADTNGAVAGALIGARFGNAAFPESWQRISDQPVLEETEGMVQQLMAAR